MSDVSYLTVLNNQNKIVRQGHKTKSPVHRILAADWILSLEEYCMRQLLQLVLSILLLTAGVL
ncbi:MAG: hypothetical protein WBV91_14575, partial [Desulfobacterales bacterium]